MATAAGRIRLSLLRSLRLRLAARYNRSTLRRPPLLLLIGTLCIAAAMVAWSETSDLHRSPGAETGRSSEPRRTATSAASGTASRPVAVGRENEERGDGAPRIALWVPCEGQARVLDVAERSEALIRVARELGVTDLFIQVVRGGRAWYRATIPDDEPYRRARESSGGEDPLARLIASAQRHDLRVHAWVNVLTLATRRETALFERLGREAVQVDRFGRSLLDYPDLEIPYPERRWLRMGTRKLWVDPAAPGVVETLEALVEELLRGYPDLNGLHLDYIRYPDVLPPSPGSSFGVGLDFGYGAASRKRFRRETGLTAPFGRETRHGRRWDTWRRERVDEVVRRLAATARGARPGLQLSAAVGAYADRSYLSLFQDWRHWLDAAWLDFAVPMAYTRDDRLLGYLAHSALRGPNGDRVWLGLGTWLFAKRPSAARRQLEQARALGAPGIAFFSYDALWNNTALRNALAPLPRATRPVGAVGRGEDPP